MGWFDFLFPEGLADAEIRVLSPAGGRTLPVRFVLKTLTIAKANDYVEAAVPGLSGAPLQFVRGHPRTLSAVLSFDGRATNADVRQPMQQIIDLMDLDATLHAPPVLSFDWHGTSIRCVLERAVAESFRSLFPDGRPSRGRMHVVFKESRTLQELLHDADLE